MLRFFINVLNCFFRDSSKNDNTILKHTAFGTPYEQKGHSYTNR